MIELGPEATGAAIGAISPEAVAPALYQLQPAQLAQILMHTRARAATAALQQMPYDATLAQVLVSLPIDVAGAIIAHGETAAMRTMLDQSFAVRCPTRPNPSRIVAAACDAIRDEEGMGCLLSCPQAVQDDSLWVEQYVCQRKRPGIGSRSQTGGGFQICRNNSLLAYPITLLLQLKGLRHHVATALLSAWQCLSRMA